MGELLELWRGVERALVCPGSQGEAEVRAAGFTEKKAAKPKPKPKPKPKASNPAGAAE